MKLNHLSILSMFILVFILNGCATLSSNNHPARKIRVAVYADEGTLKLCVDKSIQTIAPEKNMVIEKLTNKDIAEGKLATYQVLLLPGGTANGEANSLGTKGCAEITSFVKEGKGVIATCAGAYLVAKGWNAGTRKLELINAEVNDLDNWARGVQNVDCEISGSKNLNGSIFSIHYENGPPLIPADLNQLPSYTSLAKYITDLHGKKAPVGMMGGKDAIIASHFGKGKVLSFSPHPELTPGLEWMLVSAVRWAAKPDQPKEPISWESVFGTRMPKAISK